MSLPFDSVHCVTVPGAAAGWVDCVEKFGSQKVRQLQIYRFHSGKSEI